MENELTQCTKILNHPESTENMKLMCILMMLKSGSISKLEAYDKCIDHGLFSKAWMDIDQDCVDLLKRH